MEGTSLCQQRAGGAHGLADARGNTWLRGCHQARLRLGFQACPSILLVRLVCSGRLQARLEAKLSLHGRDYTVATCRYLHTTKVLNADTASFLACASYPELLMALLLSFSSRSLSQSFWLSVPVLFRPSGLYR